MQECHNHHIICHDPLLSNILVYNTENDKSFILADFGYSIDESELVLFAGALSVFISQYMLYQIDFGSFQHRYQDDF